MTQGDCLTAIKVLLIFLPVVCLGQTGASQVFTRQNGTGAVLRSVESKLRETVNASDYSGSDIGAKINAAVSAIGCGIVNLPSGSGTWSTPVIINPICTSLQGQGSQASSFSCTVNGDCLLLSQVSPYLGRQQGTVKGFSLNGTGTTNGVGIHANSAIGQGFEDIYLNGFTGVNGAGIWLENGATSKFSERNTFIRVDIENCTKLIRLSVGAGGANSFGYNNFLDLKLNLYDGQRAFSLENNAFLYNSKISAILNSNEGTNSIFHVQDSANASGNVYSITGENTAGVALNVFDVAAGLTVEGTGWIKCDGCVNNILGSVWATVSEFACGSTASRFDMNCPSYSTVPLGAAKNISGNGYGRTGTYLIPATGVAGGFLFGTGWNGIFDGTNWRCYGDGTFNSCSFLLTSTNLGYRFYQIPSTGGADQTISSASLESYITETLDSTGISALIGLKISAGIGNSSTGFQHGRFGGCATAASAGSTCTSTVTWSTNFADTNYTAGCTGENPAGVPLNGGISGKTINSMSFITVAATAVTAGYGLVDCWAVHDK